MLVTHRPASLIGSAAIAGLLVVGLGACSDEPERDESGQVTEGGEADVMDVGVGDCLPDSGGTGTISSMEVVPCSETHSAEVYFSYQVPGDTFPGDFSQVSEQQCTPAFQEFVGMPYDQSALVYTTLEPTAESWQAGDRELLCIIADPAGNVTGSLRGANR